MKRTRIITSILCILLLLVLVGCDTPMITTGIEDTAKTEDKATTETSETSETEEASTAEESSTASSESPFTGSADETYYMNVFLPGAEFWKGCMDGFQAAADQLGVNVELVGSLEYDAAQQVESFEQILAQDPAGILVCPIDPDSMTPSINKAIDMGIPVVTFYNDAEGGNHLGLFATSPEKEGEICAYKTAELLDGKGEIGLITRPQDNVARREVEFLRIMEEEFPEIKVVQSVFAEADTTKATEMTNAMLQANPNIKAVVAFAALEAIGVAQAKAEMGVDFRIITFETDPSVLDLIKEGAIDATIGQDTFSSGYWPMLSLFVAKHQLVQPYTDWEKNPWSPLPNYIEFPNPVVTIDNVESFNPPTWADEAN